MSKTAATSMVDEELHRIAPDIELSDIDRDGDIFEEFDIDSMDFLNLVIALGKRADCTMPETDYPKMGTYNNLVAYLHDHSQADQTH